MLRRNHLIAAIGISLMLAGCSDEDSPSTAPRSAQALTPGLPAPAMTTPHTQLKGLTASAEFIDIDETGCVETAVIAFGTEQTSKVADSIGAGAGGKPVTSFFIVLSVTQFNFCTGEFLRDLFGTTTEGSIQADRVKLSEAHLEAVVTTFDFMKEGEVPVEVDLTWTATAPPVSLSNRFRQKQPGLLLSFTIKGTLRDATATGTVVVGGENLTPSVSAVADISRSREGGLSISTGHSLP